MSYDYSRFNHDPADDYLGVLLQQGRPLTDADWNALVAEIVRREQADSLGTVGPAGVPASTPDGFRVELDPGGQLLIYRGRAYANGLLAENHGSGGPAWDPQLAEAYGPDPVRYDTQPYLYEPPALPGAPYLVFLDVWQREVGPLEDPDIIESALGVDTTTRLQTVWQVRALGGIAADTDCSTLPQDIAGWLETIAPSAGRLTTDTRDVPNEPDPCNVPPAGGYKGAENQLYRVEIHEGGAPGVATFKWSRDNASIQARVLRIPDATHLVVDSIGRDEVLRFTDGDWIELIDDRRELRGEAGHMRKIVLGGGVDSGTRTITLAQALAAGDFPVDAQGVPTGGWHLRIRRWDQKGIVKRADTGNQYADLGANVGVITVPADATELLLEDGIVVSFGVVGAGGRFRARDWWVFAARSGSAGLEKLTAAPPRGIHHHYVKLGIVPPGGAPVADCRPVFPPLTALAALYYRGGDGQSAFRNDPAEPNGFVGLRAPLRVAVMHGNRPVVGAEVRWTAVSHGMVIDHQAVGMGASLVPPHPTDADGLSKVLVALDPAAINDRHVIRATAFDGSGTLLGPAIEFSAEFATAVRVAYDPADCELLAGVDNVKDALDALCAAPHGSGCCSVTVGKDGEYQTVVEAILKLTAQGILDICLCLLPGDHIATPVWKDEEAAKFRALRLEIKGCGRGQCRLRLKEGDFVLDADSVTFRSMDVLGSPNSLGLRLIANSILLEDLAISGFAADKGKALIYLDSRGRIDISRCDFHGFGERVFDRSARVIDALGFDPKAVGWATDIYLAEPRAVREARMEMATTIARWNPARRSTASRNMQSAAAREKLTRAEMVSVGRLESAMVAKTPEVPVLSKAIDDFWLASTRSSPSLVLALASGWPETALRDCTVNGTLRLYGETPPNGPIAPGLLKAVGDAFRKNPEVLRPTEAALSIDNCRLHRIDLNRDVNMALADIPEGKPIEQIFRSIHLHGSRAEWLAGEVAITLLAGHDLLSACSLVTNAKKGEPIARVFGVSSSYTGNIGNTKNADDVPDIDDVTASGPQSLQALRITNVWLNVFAT